MALTSEQVNELGQGGQLLLNAQRIASRFFDEQKRLRNLRDSKKRLADHFNRATISLSEDDGVLARYPLSDDPKIVAKKLLGCDKPYNLASFAIMEAWAVYRNEMLKYAESHLDAEIERCEKNLDALKEELLAAFAKEKSA